jgi:hypothetical protein
MLISSALHGNICWPKGKNEFKVTSWRDRKNYAREQELFKKWCSRIEVKSATIAWATSTPHSESTLERFQHYFLFYSAQNKYTTDEIIFDLQIVNQQLMNVWTECVKTTPRIRSWPLSKFCNNRTARRLKYFQKLQSVWTKKNLDLLGESWKIWEETII